jgi:hypothetical protein
MDGGDSREKRIAADDQIFFSARQTGSRRLSRGRGSREAPSESVAICRRREGRSSVERVVARAFAVALGGAARARHRPGRFSGS